MLLPCVPSCLLHATRTELSLPSIRCERFRKNKYMYSLLLRSCFWLRHTPWILQGISAKSCVSICPTTSCRPTGITAQHQQTFQSPPVVHARQKQDAPREQQCQSYPGESRGEHWEAPEWQRGWEYEEQEHALLLDSAKSADPSVATHTIPGKEGGSATRDTLLLQEQLEGTCCLPATGSCQGSMFLYIPGPEHY